MKPQKIMPCLWFDHGIDEAVRLYTSVFKNCEIKGTSHYSESAATASGRSTERPSPRCSNFTAIMALNGGPHFKMSPAQSLFVTCADASEVDSLWNTLSRDGVVRMGLDKYPLLKGTAGARTSSACSGS